jgi:tRNA-2-methylthio-N6-dimethylallyladenosine synthase
MLKRMIRRYTRAEYVQRMQRLRAARSDLTLSTDVIVGFSGETEDDFAQTLSLVEEIGFTSLFGFKYSVRPHTPAQKLADDVPEETKSERLARLFELAERLTQAHLATLVGSVERVLVEGSSKNGDRAQGRTERNEIVHVEPPPGVELTGETVEVEIARANKHSLEGTVTAAALAALPRRAVGAAPPKRRALPLAPALED